MYSDRFAPGFAGIVVGLAVVIGFLIFVAATRKWLIPFFVKGFYQMLDVVEDSEKDIQDTIEQEREKHNHG